MKNQTFSQRVRPAPCPLYDGQGIGLTRWEINCSLLSTFCVLN